MANVDSIFESKQQKTSSTSDDGNGMTLYTACENGDYQLVESLIISGSRVNGCDARIPLIIAVSNGHTRCVELLLKNGAKVNVANSQHQSALKIACREHYFDIVELLLNFRTAPLMMSEFHALHSLINNEDCVQWVSFKLARLIIDVLPVGLFSFVKLSRFAFENALLELSRSVLLKESDLVVAQHYSFALHYAVQQKWFSVVTNLLGRGVDVNSFWNSETALYVACKNRCADIVELLLSRGAKPYLRDVNYDGPLPIQIACMNGDIAVVQKLFQFSSSYSMPSSVEAVLREYHPLHIAYDRISWNIVELLLNVGVNINCADKLGMTILHKAILAGRLEQVENYLELGANALLVNQLKESSLHFAVKLPKCSTDGMNGSGTSHAENRRLAIIRLLLKSGASCNAVCSRGETPLYVASCAGLEEAVSVLLEAGALVNLTKAGKYPLMAASEINNARIVEMLLRVDSSMINVPVTGGSNNAALRTPLCVAAVNGHHETLATLLQYGASVNVVSEEGRTAYDYAIESMFGRNCKSHCIKTIELLLSYGSDVNSTNMLGETALYRACELGFVDVVDLLLKRSANPNTVGQGGDSPLIAACKNKHLQVVELLLQCGTSKEKDNRNIAENDSCVAMSAKSDETVISVTGAMWSSRPIADIHTANSRGETVLHVSTNVEMTDLLLKKGARVNATTSDGATPLYIACCRRLSTVVETLLQHGADVNGASSKIPLHIACENDDFEIVTALLKNGANPDILLNDSKYVSKKRKASSFFNEKSSVKRKKISIHDESFCTTYENGKAGDTNRKSALCLMCAAGNLQIVETLLRHGASVNLVAGDSGQTPLRFAIDCVIKTEQFFNDAFSVIMNDDVTGCSAWPLQDSSGVSIPQHEITPTNWSHWTSVDANPVLEKSEVTQNRPIDRELEEVSLNSTFSACDAALRIVEILLERGADINLKDGTGRTVLHYAIDQICKVPVICSPRCVKLIDVLLSCDSCDVNTMSNDNESPLYSACEAGIGILVQKLLQRGAKGYGKRPLLAACEYERIDVVQLLLLFGADVQAHRMTPSNFVNGWLEKDSPLCIAARKGHECMADWLLQRGAAVGDADWYGNQPVDYVIEHFCLPNDVYNHSAVLFKLIDYGLYVNGLYAGGKSLLLLAVTKRWPTYVAEELLRRGANPNGVFGEHPLYEACKLESDELVNILLKGGAYPNVKKGKSPLCKAVRRGNKNVVDNLINYGADVNMPDGKGCFALQYACLSDSERLVKTLLMAGANPNLPYETSNASHKLAMNCDRDLSKPLFIAVKHKNTRIVDLLLQSQADVKATDGNKRTALHYIVKFSEGKPTRFRLSVVHFAVADSSSDSSSSSDTCDNTDSSSDAEMDGTVELVNRSLKNREPDCKPSSPVLDTCRGLNVLIKLLDYGADVNAVDEKGQTPLYMATRRHNIEFIKQMLDGRGADPNRTTSGRYPLCIACMQENEELVKTLLEAGAKPDVMAAEGEGPAMYGCVARLPLCIAAEMFNESLMRMLVKYGANCRAADWNKNNTLTYLMNIEDVEVNDEFISLVTLLLENGADPNQPHYEDDNRPVERLFWRLFDLDVVNLLKVMIRFGVRLDSSVVSDEESGRFRLKQCLVSSRFLEKTMFWLFKLGTDKSLLSRGCEGANDFWEFDDDEAINMMDIRLCMAVVLNGYRPSEADTRDFEQIDLTQLKPTWANKLIQFLFWFTEDRRNPPSLMRQCRTSIRKQLPIIRCQSISPLIDRLPLPSLLKSYLNFEGPACEVELSELDNHDL